MPVYSHLMRRLDHEIADRVDCTFADIEATIAGPLPASARRHAAWWANTASHSHAASWMRPGWRTSGVDLSGERVTFVRASGSEARVPRRALDRSASPGDATEAFSMDYFTGLSDAARHLVSGVAEARSIGWDTALAEVVNEAAAAERRRMWSWFDSRSSGAGTPAADLIREARDER